MPIKYNNICKAKCQAPSGTVKIIRVIYDCLLLTFPGSSLRTLPFSGPGLAHLHVGPVWNGHCSRQTLGTFIAQWLHMGRQGEHHHGPSVQEVVYLPSNKVKFHEGEGQRLHLKLSSSLWYLILLTLRAELFLDK